MSFNVYISLHEPYKDKTRNVIFIFSESVTGFTQDDIVLTDANGTLSELRADDPDGRVWKATFTPTPQINDDTNTISVDLGGVTDTAGNTGTGFTPSANYIVDTMDITPHLLSITMADRFITIGETPTITFTFLEPVTGFRRENLLRSTSEADCAKGTVGELTATGDGRTWTAIFKPKDDIHGNGFISVSYDGITNAAGLPYYTDYYDDKRGYTTYGTMGPDGNYLIDTKRPTATIALSDTRLTAGEHTIVTFAFSEPVVGLTLDEIEYDKTSGELSNLTPGPRDSGDRIWDPQNPERPDPGRKIWTAIFTPKDNTRSAENTIRVELKDVTDSAGNPGEGLASSGNYAIDTEPDNTTTVAPPPPPAPRPRLSTVPLSPQGLHANSIDRDGDGTPCIVEDQAPGIPGPNGPGPMPGDGNGDGSLDSKQSAVISAIVAVSPTGVGDPAGAQGSYVTLVAGSQDGKLMLDSDARLGSLVQKDAPADLPKGMEMPLGLIDFKAKPTTGHASETFSLYVDPALGVNGYWVKGNDGAWVNLASAPYGGKMVTEGDRLRLDFTIEDGGRFDADGEADGVITATGAVAQMELSIVGQAPPDATLKYGF